MKFTSIFVLYSAILGFFVGMLSALFLTIVNFCIHFVWKILPMQFHLPAYYPILFGLIGGTLVGLFQRNIGKYPKTMHETIHEFQTTKAVTYKHQLGKNFISAILVLTFGASLGPEAALASILGGLISWIGDHLKITLARKEQFLELGIGAMLSTVFHAPFVGIAEPIEDQLRKGTIQIKWKKILLYGITTFFGLLGFTLLQKIFPKEVLFQLRMPSIAWTPHVFLLIVPMFLLGLLFGLLFLKIDRLSERFAKKINDPLILALLAGALIGILGMISPYFLFSGEHEILHLSEEYKTLSITFLFFIAVGKTLLTNICFAFGWRGGKIFPAIFSSTAFGFALSTLFPYTPGLSVAIVVASSVTIILGQPIVVAALLLFLFPVQFFPLILLACFMTKKISVRLHLI